MLDRRILRLAVPLAVGALALTACGNKKESSGNGGSGSGDKTLTIGVMAPLSGEQSATGKGIRNGVELAINAANKNKTVKGYTLKLDAEDDTAKADVGATVAAKFVADNSVVGVVGPLNSSVAKAAAPVLAGASLALISPSNSNVDLTGRAALLTGTTQVRPYKSYFRVCATDDLQGPFDAAYAVKTLGKKKIAIVHDKLAYGQGLTAAFAKAAVADGAAVLPTETVKVGDKDFSATITKIKAQKPDLLFYGGQFPEAALLSKQMKGSGLNIPLMGGDGIFSQVFTQTAGTASNGDYASALGAPTATLPAAKNFLADYTAANYDVAADPYGAASFDAANAIINALAKAVSSGKSGQGLREEVIKDVQASDFDGVTSHVSFDQFGDTNSKILTIYAVKDGKFVPAKTEAVK